MRLDVNSVPLKYPKNKTFTLRPIAFALISVLALQGCATVNQKGESLSPVESLNETFNSDDPCANNARNIGIGVGVIGGEILGRAVFGIKGGGALIGAVAGALIGAEIDKRKCELSKIAKKYGLEIQVTTLTTNTNTAAQENAGQLTTKNETQKEEEAGIFAAIIDPKGSSSFLNGSDQLSADAKPPFMEIAKLYATKQPVNTIGVKLNEEKNELHKRRVLVIGHTDDTGNSKLHAYLSERRAKTVAQLFKSMGVAEDDLFYQGAGETQPIADNATEEGRAKNRRVDIVDLSNDATFKLYLQNRRPNTAFYRPVTTTVGKAPQSETMLASNAKTVKSAPAKVGNDATAVTESTAVVSKNAKPTKKLLSGSIDFGGIAATSSNTVVNIGEQVKAKQGFMLISEAKASDMGQISSCNIDRPRNAGAVKSLKDGKDYATSEFLPGLYGRTWHDTVGGNLVVLNNVKVLRDGAASANAPELKVYANYDPARNKKAKSDGPKADVLATPAVNVYQGSNGLLYRVFAEGERGVQCMDMLIAADGNATAKAGKIIYGSKDNAFVSDFKPTMYQ